MDVNQEQTPTQNGYYSVILGRSEFVVSVAGAPHGGVRWGSGVRRFFRVRLIDRR